MAVRRLGNFPYPLSLSAKPSWRIPSDIICGASYLLSKAFLSKTLCVLVCTCVSVSPCIVIVVCVKLMLESFDNC